MESKWKLTFLNRFWSGTSGWSLPESILYISYWEFPGLKLDKWCVQHITIIINKESVVNLKPAKSSERELGSALGTDKKIKRIVYKHASRCSISYVIILILFVRFPKAYIWNFVTLSFRMRCAMTPNMFDGSDNKPKLQFPRLVELIGVRLRI